MPSYVSYKDIVSKLDIREGDILNVSSDVLKWLCICRENGESFDANVFIDALLEKVGKRGTVLFPTYYWSFCRGKTFDYHNSPSETGGLSNAALKRKDFKRTKHAIYSFAVWGKDQDYLCGLENFSSFGKDSPFAYLYEKKARNLFIGVDYKFACAFVHYPEEMIGVPYRMFKDFTGGYIDANGKQSTKTFRMYVRDLSLNVITEISPKLDEILASQNAYSHKLINDVYFGVIDLHPTGEIMMEDLRNQKQLVYPKAV